MGWLVAAKPHAVLSAEGWANGLPPSHAGPGLDSAARARYGAQMTTPHDVLDEVTEVEVTVAA